MQLTQVLPENCANDTKVLCRVDHDLTRRPFRDFDVFLEDVRVSKDKSKCRNGHGLGNGGKVEDTLLLQTGEVEQAVFDVLQGIQDHGRAAVERRFFVGGIEKIFELLNVL